jgi:hypothetical protein
VARRPYEIGSLDVPDRTLPESANVRG